MISMIHSLYIDPAAVSVLAVSIGSIAIAISTTFVIWYRRAKKKVSQVLHIDANAGKEVEEDLVIVDEETNDTEN